MRESPRVGLIVGPTGAGKTAFAIALAERLGAEIVNADSRQLYRRMDLGTAKPSAAERARVTHHLIDVCDPNRPIDVAEFAALAHEAIAEIAARGRPVLIVGGSGLYLRVLRDGIFAGPPASADYRAELRALAATHGTADLHDRLKQADPEAARRISVNDLPRIIRALEVFVLSGIPISEHQRRHRIASGMADGARSDTHSGTNGEASAAMLGRPTDGMSGGMAGRAFDVMTSGPSGIASGGYANFAVGLAVPRARLYARIDRRFDAMIAAGLIDEVRGLLALGAGAVRANTVTADLLAAGGRDDGCDGRGGAGGGEVETDREVGADRVHEPGVRSGRAAIGDGTGGVRTMVTQTIGYREIARYLEGTLELPAAIELAKRESRRLAKRQMTWFRREQDLVWLDPDRGIDEALKLFREFFHPR